MRFFYSRDNIIRGGIIYTLGDTIATFITGEVQLTRILGMLIIGATIYAFEIPNFFLWVHDLRLGSTLKAKIARTLIVVAYFNPLWISRHLLFISIISLRFENINWDLIDLGVHSFLYGLPVMIPANYIIQNVITYKWRFIASAIFSGITVIYYALTEVIF